MYCDYDAPEFYVEEHVTGRKAHKCIECHNVIPVGVKHWRISGKWDGSCMTLRQHDECYAFARRLNGVEPYDLKMQEDLGGCIPFGGVAEHMADCQPDHPLVLEWAGIVERTKNDRLQLSLVLVSEDSRLGPNAGNADRGA